MHLSSIVIALVAGLAQPGPSASPKPDWDLTPIFVSAEAAMAERDAINAAIPKLARWKGKLADPAVLRSALEERSALRSRAQRYWMWAALRLNRDGADENASADMGKAMALWADIDAAAAYLEPEVVALGDARLAELTQAEPLAPYRRILSQLRTRAAHVLPAEQEALVASAQPLLRSASGVRDTLSNVELPYPTITVGGAERRLTTSGMRRTLREPDRSTRRAAWESFTKLQEGFKLTQAALLSSYLSGVAWEAKTRGWTSQTEMVTVSDPVPVAAFSALSAEAERAAKGPMARYVALKARMLGYSSVASYDLGAPIVPDTRHFTIDEAKSVTLAAVAPLGREYQDRLARGFAGKWIDWQPGPTKAPGGLAVYGIASMPAYVLIGFNGDAASVAVFAHEWGHWMHWDYSREAERPFESMAPDVSTNDIITFVHEMLVADQAIANVGSADERIMALTSAIEELRTPYYSVVAQVQFDLAARRAADERQPLTAEKLSALYCDGLKRFAPSSVAWDPRDCLGWVTEPYVYYDLYFYRYLLATSAAAWFADRVASGDQQAVEQLKALLRAGGSEDGLTLLKRAGFDVADPAMHAAMTRRLDRLTSALEREVRSKARP